MQSQNISSYTLIYRINILTLLMVYLLNYIKWKSGVVNLLSKMYMHDNQFPLVLWVLQRSLKNHKIPEFLILCLGHFTFKCFQLVTINKLIKIVSFGMQMTLNSSKKSLFMNNNSKDAMWILALIKIILTTSIRSTYAGCGCEPSSSGPRVVCLHGVVLRAVLRVPQALVGVPHERGVKAGPVLARAQTVLILHEAPAPVLLQLLHHGQVLLAHWVQSLAQALAGQVGVPTTARQCAEGKALLAAGARNWNRTT